VEHELVRAEALTAMGAENALKTAIEQLKASSSILSLVQNNSPLLGC